MTDIRIPFNKPQLTGKELYYIKKAVSSGWISGDGLFTKKCNKFIENKYSVKRVLLTTSCSSALDMSAILLNVKPGSEVILPTFTFVSTANSFLVRGARLRFIDIREDTLNIDETKIEDSINQRTKAIIVVHYAGVSCEMNKIMDIARRNNLSVVEDAAHGIGCTYEGMYLGTIGDIGCYSFHETKNVTCGEGGAILINNDKFSERAEIIREKGTNRNKFYRGEIDKYTWVDIGSSYLPSEILSAFLYAQLENIETIARNRLDTWQYYYKGLEDLEKKEFLRRPIIPENCKHNGHMFYILLNDNKTRDLLISYLKSRGISVVFHYLPLHLSPMGLRMGYKKGDFPITEKISDCILRLPIFYKIRKSHQDTVIEEIHNFYEN
ncbi:MAG: dTDP-4-amino-4,6-dideoxygalactose transaminase [Chloroflexi bacterium]|nr:dTDP-4-amino-4,6-dideoxygalactose transaminase [Chloroflexota bacterium]